MFETNSVDTSLLHIFFTPVSPQEEKQNYVIYSLKEYLHCLDETASKDCSRLLNEASKKISTDVKYSEGKQKSVVQDAIDMRKTFCERLKNHVEDEREKRKVKRGRSEKIIIKLSNINKQLNMKLKQKIK